MLSLALSKEWLNLPQRSDNQFMKSMPTQIDAVGISHDIDLFCFMMTLVGFV